MDPALVITLEAEAVRLDLPDLPVAALLLGRPTEAAAALLPRLFGLCGAAQGLAMRLALDLPVDPGAATALRREVLRDHLAKLCLRWPALLGLPPQPLPAGWDRGGDLSPALFAGPVPQDGAAFDGWLAAGGGVAPVLRALDAAFGPGEATAALPVVTAEMALAGAAAENSAAARQAGHPLLRAIEVSRGRGPLWQAAGRLCDALAVKAGDLPAPRVLADGTALVATARGLYALRARSSRGMVTEFARRTPTDHLCAPGGVLDCALAGLRDRSPARVALLADVLDPCVAVRVKAVEHA